MNMHQAIIAVQLYVRDLRLTATEREQLTGLLNQIDAISQRNSVEALPKPARELTPSNGAPDTDAARAI